MINCLRSRWFSFYYWQTVFFLGAVFCVCVCVLVCCGVFFSGFTREETNLVTFTTHGSLQRLVSGLSSGTFGSCGPRSFYCSLFCDLFFRHHFSLLANSHHSPLPTLYVGRYVFFWHMPIFAIFLVWSIFRYFFWIFRRFLKNIYY